MERKVLLTNEEILSICKSLGAQLTSDLKDDVRTPLFLGVMKGALNFMMDLIKYVDRPILTDYVQLSSYIGTETSGKVKIKKSFDADIKDRTVVIVEDVIDTGISMSYFVDFLKQQYSPKRILVCSLFSKPKARKIDIKIDYIGKAFDENYFLAGYGLDYRELERNTPYVFAATEEDIKNWDKELDK